MKHKFIFLLRYWLLVLLTPSIVIPVYSFFVNFKDIGDFRLSQIGYEINKYLFPAILIFAAVSIVVAILFIVIDLIILSRMIQYLRFWIFKIIFILISSLFIAAPFLIWNMLHHPINTPFRTIVIPTYIVSGILWGILLIRRKTFDSLKLSAL